VRIAHAVNVKGRRKYVVLAWLLAAIAIQVIGSSVGAKEISSFRLPGTESQRAYDLLSKHFPAQKGDTDQIVFRAKTGTLDDPQNKRAIEAAVAKVKARPLVASIASPFAEGGRITDDRKIGVAMLNYTKSTNDIDDVSPLEKIEKDAFTARSDALQVEHGGPGAEYVRYENTQDPSEMIGIVAAAVVLFLTFGSLIAAGIPLLATILAMVSTLGAITLVSHVVDTPDFASQLATLIGLGVGIDYALFVVTRYRAEVRAGLSREKAVEMALDTAGRTVLFAAITVVIALLGLLLLGLSFMHGVAVGAAMAVVATLGATLTLTPALIGGAGDRIDGLTAKRRAKQQEKAQRKFEQGSRWEAWSRLVQRRPWPVAAVALVILLGLAIPTLSLNLGSSDAGTDPSGTTTRKAYDLIADGFGAGTNGQFLIVTKLAQKGDLGPAQQLAAAVKQDDDFSAVGKPAVSPDGEVATIVAYPKTGPQDTKTTDALERLRDDVVPPVEKATGARVEVGGFTASNEDFSDVVASKLPLFVGVVVLLSALLLLIVFRSVVIPIKAAAMNLLSIGAALGVVTLIFQEGVGAGLLGIETGPIESFLPVMFFAIVFGLSMDYEVFLISRVHEEWEKSGDATDAVARGLATTGKVITAAASIMVVVFAAFSLGDDRVIKLFGIGLASAILFDAVIIRCLLVPAIMEILGKRAWYLPAWLDRVIPRVAIERHDDPAFAEPVDRERVPDPV
jgi:RND superfamily putative drug exporter